MEESWLRCKVLPGMFDRELLVVVEDLEGAELVSILVDQRSVRVQGQPTGEAPVTGHLLVQASRGGDFANVMLPVSSAEKGRVLSVPSTLLAG